MSLSRKDYEAIAEVIKYRVDNAGELTEKLAAQLIADGLADYFKADNSQFKRGKFFEACGL
jgi:hypothetical protein